MEHKNDLVAGEEWEPPSLASLPSSPIWSSSSIAEGVSLESLIAKHQKYTDTWRSSSGYSACHELLTNTVLKQESIQITQCMCLCLGSLSGQVGMICLGENYSRSMSQLVAFEGWVELLSMCLNL